MIDDTIASILLGAVEIRWRAIRSLAPGAAWSATGATITWQDELVPMPSEEAIDGKIMDIKKEAAIELINRLANEKIIRSAPVWRQLNALRLEGGQAQIFADIDSIRNIADQKKAEVGAAQDDDDLLGIDLSGLK